MSTVESHRSQVWQPSQHSCGQGLRLRLPQVSIGVHGRLAPVNGLRDLRLLELLQHTGLYCRMRGQVHPAHRARSLAAADS